MNKFEINQDIIDNYKGMTYCHYSTDDLIEYVFINTPVGDRITIKPFEDYTHHRNVFMVLMELEGFKDSGVLWWHNQSFEISEFKALLKACLHNEYMNEWFPKATEYVIQRELSELNDLIDYTEYWTK